jgi:cytoskeletal protein CcmA (bactofilin family)
MTDVQNDALEEGDFDTVLAPDVDFDGAIVFEKSALVRGTIRGTIRSQSILLIDEGAIVSAHVSGDKIVIRGDVTGNIDAREGLRITSKGRLRGNITSPKIIMDNDCIFNGLCTMPDPTEAVSVSENDEKIGLKDTY